MKIIAFNSLHFFKKEFELYYGATAVVFGIGHGLAEELSKRGGKKVLADRWIELPKKLP